MVELISATTTKTGLQVHCELDPRAYPKGIAVSDAKEMDTLNIRGNPFHPGMELYHRPQSAAVKQSLLGVA